ncbi:hypothetical protein PWW31_18530 [Vibrio harveyi]|nr:hypothetical protein PWW31_18530 [Vibrio harveyi]
MQVTIRKALHEVALEAVVGFKAFFTFNDVCPNGKLTAVLSGEGAKDVFHELKGRFERVVRF